MRKAWSEDGVKMMTDDVTFYFIYLFMHLFSQFCEKVSNQ